MKSSQIVNFVVDKDLDIKNHLIGFDTYKRNKENSFPQFKNERIENLILRNATKEEIIADIEKSMERYYKNKDKLISLTQDINKEWVKIEEKFIKKLEEIHKFPFTFTSIKGVLSAAGRFGYNMNEGWFAADMFGNKFVCMDVATHELMHFMFHKYYDKICEENELSKNQMWDVKESFTVLLNLECDNFRFRLDQGYSPHKDLREVIKKSWEQNHDFNKTLEDALKYVKSV
jgi:hypothetical protein